LKLRDIEVNMRWILLSVAVAALVSIASCNSVPVSGLEKSFSLQVSQTYDTGDPVKIDFLWVIDNSASMCQEQVGLASSFKDFTDKLIDQFELDAQVGVVTSDMHCDPQNPQIHASMGQFSRKPAESFPPSCHQQIRYACTADDDCRGLDGYNYGQKGSACALDTDCGDGEECILEPSGSGTCQGIWTCEGAGNLPALCIENPNGTTNTSCKRLCTADEQCQELFGDPRYTCQNLSTTQNVGGCLLPPDTVGCPSELPPFLTSEDLDLFPCLATVGVNQLKCYNYEQGLAAGLAALDPSDRNYISTNIECSSELPCPEPKTDAWDDAAESNWGLIDTSERCTDPSACKDKGGQNCVCNHVSHLECVDGRCRGPNYGFLRDDAYLVIVFVSDEDDCSAQTDIGEDYYDQCGLLDILKKQPGDSDKGGPLVNVSTYVNRFKSLKSDPSRVIVAAIAGDAVPNTPEQVAANIAPSCATCSVTGAACDVSWNIQDHKYIHACSSVSCSDGTCGNTTVTCSSDGDCSNGCISAGGQPLSMEDSNQQDPLCKCLPAPASFSVTDYDDADTEIALEKQAAFAADFAACMQEQYIDSKGNEETYDCYSSSYICSSDAGIADWGARYRELAERFGPNGIFTNICDGDLTPALTTIANNIINIVNKICLPKQIADVNSILVTKTMVEVDDNGTPVKDAVSETFVMQKSGCLVGDDCVSVAEANAAEPCEPCGEDVIRTMLMGAERDYELIPGGEDCKIDGEEHQAVKFTVAPATGETVYISFSADPELDL
jgi:hypothetical protein